MGADVPGGGWAMLKLVGALLLTAGASALGLCAAGQLRDRVKALRSLAGGLEILGRELSFRRTAMPELMERTARQAGEPARYLWVSWGRDRLDRSGPRRWRKSQSCFWGRRNGLYCWSWERSWAAMMPMTRSPP